jgi:hypothetical protein
VIKMLLQRKWVVKDATLGELFLDGSFECYTCEDIVRPINQKIPGQTAIPTGSYRVVVDWSNRFQKNMLHILDVPGFEGVRIHAGNSARDTDGCVLVGQTVDTVNASIGASRIAYEQLFRKLYDEKDLMIEIREI